MTLKFSPGRLPLLKRMLLGGFLFLVTASPLQAQDVDSMVENWDQKFTAIQELIPKLRSSSNEDERAQLMATYRKSLEEINQLRKEIEPTLIEAAQEAETLDGKLGDTLLDLGQLAYSDELYDRSYRLLAPLVDHNVEDETVYQFAAMSAYGSDRLTEAKAIVDRIQADGNTIKIPVLKRVAGTLDQQIADWKKEQEIRAREAEADDLPRVKLETTEGDIVIELFENQAPNSVANFISLVEKGFYDGLTFHRVLPQFMAQGGCPDGTGAGGPGYAIDCECHGPDYRHHYAGTLSMAHAGRDTGGSQFFLTFLPTPHLDGRHTAFGRVIEGMENLGALKRVNPQQPVPGLSPSRIVKATVIRKRDHKYEPETHKSRR